MPALQSRINPCPHPCGDIVTFFSVFDKYIFAVFARVGDRATARGNPAPKQSQTALIHIKDTDTWKTNLWFYVKTAFLSMAPAHISINVGTSKNVGT